MDVERSSSHENRFSDLPHCSFISISARFLCAIGPSTHAEDCSASEQSASNRRAARVQAGICSTQSGFPGQWND